MRATTKKKYIDAGRCANGCKGKAVEGKLYCESCVKSQAESRVRRYHDAIRNGLCPECHENAPRAGIKVCDGCAAYHAGNSAKRREDLKAKGLCIKCGKNPLVNKTYCKQCNEWRNKRRRELCAEKSASKQPKRAGWTKGKPRPKRAPRPVTTMVRKIDLEDVLFSTNSKSWGGMILRRVIARMNGKPVQGSVAAIWSAEWDAGRGLHWPDLAAVRERLEQGRNAA